MQVENCQGNPAWGGAKWKNRKRPKAKGCRLKGKWERENKDEEEHPSTFLFSLLIFDFCPLTFDFLLPVSPFTLLSETVLTIGTAPYAIAHAERSPQVCQPQ